MMDIRPVHNHLICKRIVLEAKSAGGIILTSTTEENTTHAEVLAIGPKVLSGIAVGDVITYIDGDSRIHRELINKEYILIMPEDCVLGVVE